MMTKRSYAFAILIALALVVNAPYVSLAQNTQAGQAPQPKGGVAIVVGVDQPENCLRIRSGPGGSYDVIGCANMGEQLNITGVWTSNDWAQLADNGWVYGPQIQTDLRPPPRAYSQTPTYVISQELTPDYGDWAYLPDYGYETYWYSGIPIYVYGINVWHRYHPWWWHRGHQAWWWRDGHHGKRVWNATEFSKFANVRGRGGVVTRRANISPLNRAGIRRNFRTDRATFSPSNLSRFNTNRFRSGSVNAFRSRNFSTPHVFRSGHFGGMNFGGIAPSGGFSRAGMGGGAGFHFGGGHFGFGGRMGGFGGRRR